MAEKTCREWNALGNCMLVVGPASRAEMAAARALAGDMTFLVPGVGAQGGDLEILKAGLNSRRKGLIVVSARAVIFADDPGQAAAELRERINRFR